MTLIALDEGARLSGLQRIVENDASADASDASDPSDADSAESGEASAD